MDSPATILPEAAARFGAKPALVTNTRTMTFAELDVESDRVGAGLVARGVRPGDTVSIYSQNRWEWIVAYHGALKMGAVVNPVNVMLTAEELIYVLQDCESTAVFVGGDRTEVVLEAAGELPGVKAVVTFDDDTIAGAVSFTDLMLEDAPSVRHSPRPEQACVIAYTSGTTGHPKGAVQSHRGIALNCGLTATMHGRDDSDVIVTALPAAHVYGNVAINGTLMAGGTVVLMERFDASRALELIAEHRATLFEGVPAMYATLLADPNLAAADLSSLTRCTVGGQTMPLTTMEHWQVRSGAPLIELWGMTELSGLGTTHARHAQGPLGSVGVSLPGVEVRISDLSDTSREATAGVAGELTVRGPIVMLEYYKNPEATAEVLDEAGWLRTGDIATKDAAGNIFVVDRRKDMIITGGYNVYPAEIERVLTAHPAIALVAVGPLPDHVKGEVACAYVVLKAGVTVTEDEVIAFSATRLAAYKRPRSVRFVSDLPKTSSGKIMRRKLADSNVSRVG
ncbi:AMP-binding protein (plasmid) [Rhodococcus sp. USK10]|uniref:class I adenylate-forming enzyme family protein n=1 Tax=Rhodococcus sp. USK10 TaxID=2789739 RepID=UPI001C5F4DA2|nr:AMP-binding protein [Rhodococcus sp. USK10]QYB00574.1 AMP-binding protein [Rhodococcus sp. USK10]